jgi:hypothetical protein
MRVIEEREYYLPKTDNEKIDAWLEYGMNDYFDQFCLDVATRLEDSRTDLNDLYNLSKEIHWVLKFW